MEDISCVLLIDEGETILEGQWHDSLGFRFVNNKRFKEWERSALLFLQNYYPDHPQTKDFASLVQQDNNDASTCEQMLGILKAFDRLQPSNSSDSDHKAILINLFERFHVVAKQLLRRHQGRETLRVTDEYDVQDLLEALLKIFFSDIRPEEWSPSYAGGSKRMDFLLKNEEVAIEVKMTREGLSDKILGEQLIIDIANYSNHPKCKQLYCFIYDPEGRIRNPRGLEKDLTQIKEGLHVFTFVYPR